MECWNDGVMGYWNDRVFTVSQRLRNIGHSAGAERQGDLLTVARLWPSDDYLAASG